MGNISISDSITIGGITTIILAILGLANFLKSILDRVEKSLSDLKSEFKSDLSKIDSKIDKVEANLKSELAKVDSKIDKVEASLKSELKAGLTEVKSKIDKVDESVRLLERSDYFTKGYEKAKRELARNK